MLGVPNKRWGHKYVIRTPRLRRYVINQWKIGITPISEIAKNRRVPRRNDIQAD